MENKFDVIVIGAGHAGNEAAFSAASLGSKVLLLCTNLNCIAMMPCNPSVGGPGKGHLVKEIDALGGQIGKWVDATCLQMRELNESRGPAVRALRAQVDKRLYHYHVKKKIEEHPGITLVQGEAKTLEKTDSGYQVTIVTELVFQTKTVILCTGTFLNGAIILGKSRNPGGPSNESAAIYLSSSLKEMGIELKRLQTATPPRISGSSICFENLKELPGSHEINGFSDTIITRKQRSCYLTFTTEKTINAVRNNLVNSPLKLGNITQHGPKHCPSIDRKVIRFPDQIVHQIFLEPESDFNDEWYLQGLTTSMPPEAQEEVLKSVPGLENAKILRYGYAIEYDAVESTQLDCTLQLKNHRGLFCAGQINGTSGYEEAAAQGLIAGINAHLKARNQPPFVLSMASSYLATFIQDLVSVKREEPLRVTTSSSDFRLHFRNDNAKERLGKIGFKLGLISQKEHEAATEEQKLIEKEIFLLKEYKIRPTKKNLEILASLGSEKIKNPLPLSEILARSEIRYQDLQKFGYHTNLAPFLVEKVEIRLKYEFFLLKFQKKLIQIQELEKIKIPDSFEYDKIPGICEKTISALKEIKPQTLAQISRMENIPGSEITLLYCAFNGKNHESI